MDPSSTTPDAVVAVVRRKDRVLVVKRGPRAARPGYWAPVSGRVEPGESHEQAVVREVAEEVGLAVTPVTKVWECDTDDGRFRLHWWTATARDSDVSADPAEVADVRWVTPDEFLDLHPTFAAHRTFFTEVLAGLAASPRRPRPRRRR